MAGARGFLSQTNKHQRQGNPIMNPYTSLFFAALALPLLPLLGRADNDSSGDDFDRAILRNDTKLFKDGRQIFRYDMFGDEAFWGDALKLHLALAGQNLGGLGPGVV
jgi:hypothetical protein